MIDPSIENLCAPADCPICRHPMEVVRIPPEEDATRRVAYPLAIYHARRCTRAHTALEEMAALMVTDTSDGHGATY
jgi:hypothetical protein